MVSLEMGEEDLAGLTGAKSQQSRFNKTLHYALPPCCFTRKFKWICGCSVFLIVVVRTVGNGVLLVILSGSYGTRITRLAPPSLPAAHRDHCERGRRRREPSPHPGQGLCAFHHRRRHRDHWWGHDLSERRRLRDGQLRERQRGGPDAELRRAPRAPPSAPSVASPASTDGPRRSLLSKPTPAAVHRRQLPLRPVRPQGPGLRPVLRQRLQPAAAQDAVAHRPRCATGQVFAAPLRPAPPRVSSADARAILSNRRRQATSSTTATRRRRPR